MIDMNFEIREYVYKQSVDGKIKLNVYGSFDHVSRPVIFMIHGGGLIGGHRGKKAEKSPEQIQRYIDAGYLVVSPDYRLAPEVKINTIIGDISDAYDWVRNAGPGLFHADASRIAAMGHSAGGYLALMTGFCVNPRPKVIVSFYGYCDITMDWYSKPSRHYLSLPLVSKEVACAAVGGPVLTGSDQSPVLRSPFQLYCRQNGLWPLEVGGYDPATEPWEFDRFCPVRNISADYPPTMLLHGVDDTDVPYGQSVLMSRELAKQGVEQRCLIVPGGPHGFDIAGRIDSVVLDRLIEEVLDFMKKHLDL